MRPTLPIAVMLVTLAGCGGAPGTAPASTKDLPAAAAPGVSTTASLAADIQNPVVAQPAVELQDASVVEAALRVVELGERLLEGSPDEAASLVAAGSAPEAAAELSETTRAQMESLQAASPAGLALRVAPIAAKVIDENEHDAAVAVWVVQVLTGAGGVRVGYSTVTVDLRSVDGEWRLVDLTSTPGPVPSPTQEPTDPARFEAELVGFENLEAAP